MAAASSVVGKRTLPVGPCLASAAALPKTGAGSKRAPEGGLARERARLGGWAYLPIIVECCWTAASRSLSRMVHSPIAVHREAKARAAAAALPRRRRRRRRSAIPARAARPAEGGPHSGGPAAWQAGRLPGASLGGRRSPGAAQPRRRSPSVSRRPPPGRL